MRLLLLLPLARVTESNSAGYRDPCDRAVAVGFGDVYAGRGVAKARGYGKRAAAAGGPAKRGAAAEFVLRRFSRRRGGVTSHDSRTIV